jgi:hypothetical protein
MLEDSPVSMYEVLEALEAALRSAEPAKREALAQTIDAYCEDFPDEFFWATGVQSPLLLHHLIMAVDVGCRPESKVKQRGVIRLVDRKPEGNA